MVADPASQLNCPQCKTSYDALGVHLCPSCALPLPLTGEEDFFSALGLRPSLSIDVSHLEKTFYALSRSLHPDRFAAAPPAVRIRSIDRMTLLNQAYRTLKDPSLRRAYFLKWATQKWGLPEQPKPAGNELPVELMEIWFELQDQPENASLRQKFQKELSVFELAHSQKLESIETQINELLLREGLTPEELKILLPPLCQALGALLKTSNYLKSLKRTSSEVG